MIDPIIPIPTTTPPVVQDISGDAEFSVFSDILEAATPLVAEDLLGALEDQDPQPETPENAEIEPQLDDVATPRDNGATSELSRVVELTAFTPRPANATSLPETPTMPTERAPETPPLKPVGPITTPPATDASAPIADPMPDSSPEQAVEPPPNPAPEPVRSSHAHRPRSEADSKLNLPPRGAPPATGPDRPHAKAPSVRPTGDVTLPAVPSVEGEDAHVPAPAHDHPRSTMATDLPMIGETPTIAPTKPHRPPLGPTAKPPSVDPGLRRSIDIAPRPAISPIQPSPIETPDQPEHRHADHTIEPANNEGHQVERSGRPDRTARPMVTRMVERIESWIRRSENMPPPRVMTIGGPHLGGLRLRVSIDAGTLSIQVHGASNDDLAWVQQVSEQLVEKGFNLADISEFDEHGHRRPLWEDDRTRHRPRQRFILDAEEQGDEHD